MLPQQFFGQDVHFIIGLLAALVFFAVFWLYFDAWLSKHRAKDIYKWVGFLFIALSFLAYATIVEYPIQGRTLISSLSDTLSQVLRAIGYISILISEFIDPLQKRPKGKNADQELLGENQKIVSSPERTIIAQRMSSIIGKLKGLLKKKQVIYVTDDSLSSGENLSEDYEQDHPDTPKSMSVAGSGAFVNPLHFFLPLGAIAISVLYWRRYSKGFERHLKSISIAFLLLSGFEVLSLAGLWSGSSNPSLVRFVALFGPVWAVDNILLLATSIVLGRWVWKYLTKRFVSQLFMIFITMALGIFLITTVCFTYLLVNSVQRSALSNLNTAASVLKYVINAKSAETLDDSQTVAENPAIASAVMSDNHDQLVSLTNSFLYSKGETSLLVTNSDAEVLLRADDPDRYGDSLSSDTLIRRALIGESPTSINIQSGVLSPLIYIQSATPIRNSQQQIVGAAMSSFAVNSAFVNGIKQSTGLYSSIYAGNVVSATTFLAADGITPLTGVKETDSAVLRTVLHNGQTYKGTVNILNEQYLGAYLPLKNVDNSVVGMLFIGQPSLNILKAASHSIQLTFVITVALLVMSIAPAYLMAKHIARQLE